jgi:RNA recognition motif-containing protein
MSAIYAAVENVNIIADREIGRARGFAFVEMPNSSKGEMAIVGERLRTGRSHFECERG